MHGNVSKIHVYDPGAFLWVLQKMKANLKYECGNVQLLPLHYPVLKFEKIHINSKKCEIWHVVIISLQYAVVKIS